MRRSAYSSTVELGAARASPWNSQHAATSYRSQTLRLTGGGLANRRRQGLAAKAQGWIDSVGTSPIGRGAATWHKVSSVKTASTLHPAECCRTECMARWDRHLDTRSRWVVSSRYSACRLGRHRRRSPAKRNLSRSIPASPGSPSARLPAARPDWLTVVAPGRRLSAALRYRPARAVGHTPPAFAGRSNRPRPRRFRPAIAAFREFELQGDDFGPGWRPSGLPTGSPLHHVPSGRYSTTRNNSDSLSRRAAPTKLDTGFDEHSPCASCRLFGNPQSIISPEDGTLVPFGSLGTMAPSYIPRVRSLLRVALLLD